MFTSAHLHNVYHIKEDIFRLHEPLVDLMLNVIGFDVDAALGELIVKQVRRRSTGVGRLLAVLDGAVEGISFAAFSDT